MQNLKIRVSRENVEEVIDLLVRAGHEMVLPRKKLIGEVASGNNQIVDTGDGLFTTVNFYDVKEITLPELRAMVNPINEYLEPLPNGEYKYHSNVSLVGGEWIKIPEGAEVAVYDGEKISFAKKINDGEDVLIFDVGQHLDLDKTEQKPWSEFVNLALEVIWKREQDEPFLTPETTLNDQYAEIEQVWQQSIEATLAERQTQYGCYEDVAQVTQQILSALRIGNYDKLPAPMKESLHMMASKMARIVNGDPEYFDNWHDIGGYAKLIEKLIKGE